MNYNVMKGGRLRPLEPEDVDFLYSIENDADLWDKGCTNVPYSHYALSNYILNGTFDIYADKQMRLLIEDEEGVSVGLVDVFNFEPRHLRAEIGIAVERKHRNRGLGLLALKKIIAYCRETLHLHQVYAYVGADNLLSLRLFEAAGFVKAATLKDWVARGERYEDAVVMQIFL